MSDEMKDEKPDDIVAAVDAAALVRVEDPATAPATPDVDGAAGEAGLSAGDDDDTGGMDDSLPEVQEDIDWEALKLCVDEPQNDIGNSRRLRHRFGDDLLHIQNIGMFAWDGRRWAEDIDLRHTRPRLHATAELIGLEPLLIQPTAEERAILNEAEAAKIAIRDCEAQLLVQGEGEAADKRRREQDIRADIAQHKAIVREAGLIMAVIRSRRQSRKKYSVSSGNGGKLSAMLDEAKAFMSHPIGDLDADPLSFNVGNGTLHFRPPVAGEKQWRVELLPHTKTDLISKLADVDYDPEAKAPMFHEFTETVLPKEAVRGFLQRFFGYGLTALTSEQVFVLLHGEGRNGKSTLVDVIAKIMADYSTSLPVSTLVNDNRGGKGSEATPDLARLPGARLVRTAEPKEGLAFDESLIKGLTSGEPMPVRRLQKDFVDVYPTFKLIISANRKPTIRGNDDGIWRRVRMVPFDVQIAEDKTDKRLPDKLWAERSGILNWLIEGALAYLEIGGLAAPDEVTAATQEYREESDMVGGFVRAALEVTGNPYDEVETGRLYACFMGYCRRQGVTPMSGNTFNRRLPKAASQFGFTKGKSSISVYGGLRIREGFEPAAQHRDHEDDR